MCWDELVFTRKRALLCQDTTLVDCLSRDNGKRVKSVAFLSYVFEVSWYGGTKFLSWKRKNKISTNNQKKKNRNKKQKQQNKQTRQKL